MNQRGYDPYNHVPDGWMHYRDQWSASEIAAMKANAEANWGLPLARRRYEFNRTYDPAFTSGNRTHRPRMVNGQLVIERVPGCKA